MAYNWFLVVVVCVVVPLVLAVNAYLLVHYAHPGDRNQAWLPKLVVLLGLSLCTWSVLLLPLDIANRAACDDGVVASACELTLPMRELWFAVYVLMAAWVGAVVPFCLFYYEADSELSFFGRVFHGAQWTIMIMLVSALVLGLGYGLAGYVDYDVRPLYAGLTDIGELTALAIGEDGSLTEVTSGNPNANAWSCAPHAAPEPNAPKLHRGCDALLTPAATELWTLRPSFLVYVIALVSIVGWLLFMVYSGVGVISVPVDAIMGFIYRPRTVITRSEYERDARLIAKRSKELAEIAQALRQDERSGGKTRRWKRSVAALNKELILLEEEEAELQELFPQGEDADTKWAMVVVGHALKFAWGIFSVLISLAWLLHIVLYVFVQPPVSPFLNDFFIELDDAFPLFGVLALSVFCFYLVCTVVAGNFRLGVGVGFVTVHPMRVGGTLMSSFLFNTGVIMLSCLAVIQFCAQAFDAYANDTEIEDIFGNQIEHLRGIKYLYTYNVFMFAFCGLAFLSACWLAYSYSRDPRRGRVGTGGSKGRLAGSGKAAAAAAVPNQA